MYQALYRKYRPTTIEDVVGQKVIIQTLKNSIINQKISHAYLFTGPRGTGKTSIAKILAKLINCESLSGTEACNKCVSCTQTNNKQNTDIIEIDAASNNGVDEIRELRDKVNLVPSYGKYKVYIIDEVHMLTQAAFNALLKTLEEPPKHIVFILATTEPHKIPETILSRCQKFDFKKISEKEIIERLTYVTREENILIEENAIKLIANLSDGGMRDSLSLLDQLTSYTQDKITIKDVHSVYGTLTIEEISDLVTKISEKNLNDIYNLINKYDEEGKSLNRIILQIINYLKNVLIFINSEDYFNNLPEKKAYSTTSKQISDKNIYTYIDILLDTLKSNKNISNIKLLFELSIIKLFEINSKTLSSSSIGLNDEISKTITKISKDPIKKQNIENVSEIKSEGINLDILEEIKKIRINNSLAKFNKKELLEFKPKLEDIKIYLMNPDYSSIVSLVIDGELKVKGDKNLLFVFSTQKMEDLFNCSINKIDELMKMVYDIEFKSIAISLEEWERLKKDFNSCLKSKINKYTFKEEPSSLIKKISVQETQKSTNNDEITIIDSEFNDIVVYE